MNFMFVVVVHAYAENDGKMLGIQLDIENAGYKCIRMLYLQFYLR
jgi:hypothetical protein